MPCRATLTQEADENGFSERLFVAPVRVGRRKSTDRSPNHEERALDAPLSSVWYSLRESNPQLALRRGLLYPFN